ncbi:MAG: transposase [Planctomycetes bacterium]|nr:transposase [Planctomycetota bacterium]
MRTEPAGAAVSSRGVRPAGESGVCPGVVVYSKPPFWGAEQTLKYLARYTHRVAISNARLLDVSDASVTFPTRTTRRAACERR